MSLTIRTATVEDAPALLDYARDLFAEDLPGIFRWPLPTPEEEVEFVLKHIAPQNSTMLVAEKSGRIAGMLNFAGDPREERRHVGEFGLSVHREFRGQGIGTSLIEALFDWARRSGIHRIEAHAWENNPRALELYRRLGFVEEGVQRDALLRDGAYIDVVCIARLL